ncbi:MAG: SRPBCC domain-containing protein [Phycisphaerales bacterium]|nr:SRPBCC domain-containing protein [Phycisphaerales bacterium]
MTPHELRDGAHDTPGVDRRRIHFAVDVRATADRLWDALTRPESIVQWCYPTRCTLDRLEPGGAYTFHDGDDPADFGEILVADPPRALRFRWRSSEPEPTIVDYRLEAAPDGEVTRITFTCGPFRAGPRWDDLYHRDFTGWVSIVMKLKRLIEAGAL